MATTVPCGFSTAVPVSQELSRSHGKLADRDVGSAGGRERRAPSDGGDQGLLPGRPRPVTKENNQQKNTTAAMIVSMIGFGLRLNTASEGLDGLYHAVTVPPGTIPRMRFRAARVDSKVAVRVYWEPT